MNMISLEHVAIASNGRIISDTSPYDRNKNRGINQHNIIGKLFADIFGSGTISMKIEGKVYYLNKNSCFNLVGRNGCGSTGNDPTLTNRVKEHFKSISDLHPHQKLQKVVHSLKSDSIRNSPKIPSAIKLDDLSKSSIETTPQANIDNPKHSTPLEESSPIEDSKIPKELRAQIDELKQKIDDMENAKTHSDAVIDTYKKLLEQYIKMAESGYRDIALMTKAHDSSK